MRRCARICVGCGSARGGGIGCASAAVRCRVGAEHQALAIECHRRIDADKTVDVRDRLVGERGTAPGFLRCDNRPEMTANAIRDSCRFSRAGSAYIEPGSAWQNAYVESFGGRVRDELLAVELFSCLTEARVLIEELARRLQPAPAPQRASDDDPGRIRCRSPSALPPAHRNRGLGRVEQRWSLPLDSGDPEPAACQPGNDRVLLRRSTSPLRTPNTTAATVAPPSPPPSSHCRWTDERAPVTPFPRQAGQSVAATRCSPCEACRRRPMWRRGSRISSLVSARLVVVRATALASEQERGVRYRIRVALLAGPQHR
jgi:Integrase core domain